MQLRGWLQLSLPCPYGASQCCTAIATNLNGCCRGQCHLPANTPRCRLRNQARAGGTASMCWLPGTSPPCPAGWGSPAPLPHAPCHPAACSQQPRMSVCRGSPAERRTDGSTLGFQTVWAKNGLETAEQAATAVPLLCCFCCMYDSYPEQSPAAVCLDLQTFLPSAPRLCVLFNRREACKTLAVHFTTASTTHPCAPVCQP